MLAELFLARRHCRPGSIRPKLTEHQHHSLLPSRRKPWRLADMCSLPVKQNRLKNRFNFCFSNGEFLEVIDFIGAPEGIRTPDPQIRSFGPAPNRL